MWRQPLDMGLQELTSPGKGGRGGGAWRRTAKTGSSGMKEKWRGRVTTTRPPGNGRHTGGHMPHCVGPRRTARMGSWEATGKSSQTPVARHRWVRTRRECDYCDRRIWPGRSGDHTRSWSKSCVMPFERERAAAQSKQSSMQQPWHTPWGWSASRFQNGCGRQSRRHSEWKRSPHMSGEVLRLCRSWHTKRIQSSSRVWWDSQYFQRCWVSESARRPASASTGWGFWQERRSSMTAKSTGLGLPVRFQAWPSNGSSSAPGLHKGAGTSTSSSDWPLRTNCKMSWQPFCVDPSGRTSDGMHGDAWAQLPCTRLEARSLASRRGSGGGAQGRQWPTSAARTQGASGTHSRRLPPPSYLKGRPWISGTATRRCTEFWAPESYDIPEGNAPKSDSGDSTCSGLSSYGGRPMAGRARGDTAREEATGRTACGAVRGGGNRGRHQPATTWVGSTSREG